MKFDTYTGGAFETNAYAIDLPEGGGATLLIDAPEGSADWLRAADRRARALLLTHAHIDHVQDAAEIAREHGCPIFHHKDGLPLLTNRDAYRRYGLDMDFEPVLGGRLIDETGEAEFAGIPFQLLLVPGHCPGSLCFFHKSSQTLFSGDTLFAGAVGRWDIPGGDRDLLLTGIRKKLFPLGDAVRVYAGHGPPTTIGAERTGSPFFA